MGPFLETAHGAHSGAHLGFYTRWACYVSENSENQPSTIIINMERRKGKGFRGSGKPQSSSSSSSSPSSYASNSPQRPMRAAENPDRTAPSVNDEQKTLERDEGPSEIPSLIGACPDMCPGT